MFFNIKNPKIRNVKTKNGKGQTGRNKCERVDWTWERNWSQSKRQPFKMNKLQGTQRRIDSNENLIKDTA